MTPYKTVVITPAADQNLITVSLLKTELGISGSSEDTYFGTVVARASAIAASYCGRVFISETVDDYFRIDCRAPDKLILSRYPLGTITTVTEDGEALTVADWETDPVAGFMWRLDGDDNRRLWGSGKTVIRYPGGYANQAAVPADLQKAVLDIAVAQYRAKGRDPLLKEHDIPGLGSRSFWVGSTGEDTNGLPDGVSGVLDRYRAYGIA